MTQKYIYIIGHDTAFKIGFSSDPEYRLKQLQTANPHVLCLLWSMERQDAVKLEKHLHVKFNKHKMTGEWFDRTTLAINLVIAESYNYTKYDW